MSSKKQILFVDDHPKVLEALGRMLRDQKERWELRFTDSVYSALELIANEKYDAVVTDIKMPGRSGLELLAELKNGDQTRDIEVIVLTGLEDRRLKQQALELGAADLLNKPVEKEDLIARLNSALRQKSYRDDLLAQKILLEQQLMQSQKMEIIGLLAAGAAHDLNNILAIMVGYSDLVEQHLNAGPEVQKNLSKISAAGIRARKIVKQILEFSRAKEQKLARASACVVVGECLELFSSSLPKGIRIHWERPQEEYIIPVDSTQLFQVLMNLFINAAQAMESKGVLSVHLDEGNCGLDNCEFTITENKQQMVKLKVADTGKGMDKDTITHIFDPMFSTKRDRGGTGLGLNVVKRIVDNAGGRIVVESTPGEGTTFSLFFPCLNIKGTQVLEEEFGSISV